MATISAPASTARNAPALSTLGAGHIGDAAGEGKILRGPVVSSSAKAGRVVNS